MADMTKVAWQPLLGGHGASTCAALSHLDSICCRDGLDAGSLCCTQQAA